MAGLNSGVYRYVTAVGVTGECSDRAVGRAQTLGDAAAAARRPAANQRQAGRASGRRRRQRRAPAARHRLQHGPTVHGASMHTQVCTSHSVRRLVFNDNYSEEQEAVSRC